MTREQILKRYPNASESTIQRNLEEDFSPGAILLEPQPMVIRQMKRSTDEDKLNKTERAYLAYMRASGYVWIGIQNITLKLADDTRFTPDFASLDKLGCLTFTDVKGFQREDALIKIKVAARMFPFADFVIVKKAKDGWEHTHVKP